MICNHFGLLPYSRPVAFRVLRGRISTPKQTHYAEGPPVMGRPGRHPGLVPFHICGTGAISNPKFQKRQLSK